MSRTHIVQACHTTHGSFFLLFFFFFTPFFSLSFFLFILFLFLSFSSFFLLHALFLFSRFFFFLSFHFFFLCLFLLLASFFLYFFKTVLFFFDLDTANTGAFSSSISQISHGCISKIRPGFSVIHGFCLVYLVVIFGINKL